MTHLSKTTPLNINPEQIKLTGPKAAKYSGIEAKKGTKILDSNGKLVSKWGRNVKLLFDKIFINKEKHATKTKIYDFLKNMTKRRVEVLIEEVQEDNESKSRSDHVDKILKLTESIPKECTFFFKNQFRNLIESDIEVYLSHEIDRCRSGADLVVLKKEVNRLKADDKVSIKVIDLLNKKIHQHMEVLVNAMPDHLKSIPYEGDPKKDFNMARKKCHAIKNLLDAAEQIDKSLVYRYGEEICEMMMKSFSRDVREIKKSCLKHINLEQNEQLITGIKDLREETVKPFFNRVSLHPDKHCNKIQANTTKAINELAKTHNPASNLNNEARTDSAVTGKTKTPILQQNPHSNTLLDLQPAAPITFQGAPVDAKYNRPIVPKRELNKVKTLGEGNSGSVYLMKHRKTNQQFALKKVGNQKVRKKECEQMIKIQRSIAETGGNTDNIVNLVALSRGKSDKKYALMEYGGDDLEYSSLHNGPFSGDKLKSTFFQAANGINTLFKAGYQHHDIKPENILINDKGVVKICDFGFATKIDETEPMVRSGSPGYMSPEKLYGLTDYPKDKADSWALGCTFAEICLGDDTVIMPVTPDMYLDHKMPYQDAVDILKKKRKKAYRKLLKIEGEQAADFFWALTEPDPDKRLSPSEALEHPYFDDIHTSYKLTGLV